MFRMLEQLYNPSTFHGSKEYSTIRNIFTISTYLLNSLNQQYESDNFTHRNGKQNKIVECQNTRITLYICKLYQHRHRANGYTQTLRKHGVLHMFSYSLVGFPSNRHSVFSKQCYQTDV